MTSGTGPIGGSRDHPPVMGGVPPADPDFTGREAILEQIHEALQRREGARYLIGGGSGVGKSLIARQYAHRYAEHYDLIWWVPAATDIDANGSFLRLAEQIGLTVSHDHIARTVQGVRRALTRDPRIGSWLLVFDGAADIETLVSDYVPEGGPGRVLITSRDHRRPRWNRVGRLIDGRVVPRLDTAESLSLLRKVCPERVEPLGTGERLAEHLEHLPLALSQVGAFLRESPLETEEFFERFQERYTDMVTRMGTDDEHTAPLAAAWAIQAEELLGDTDDDTGRAVVELVRLCAFLAPLPLSRSFFTRARGLGDAPGRRGPFGDEVRLDRVLEFMRRRRLVSVDPGNDTFHLHELFQEVIRDSMPLVEKLRYRELARRVLAHNDPGEPADPAHRDRYLVLHAHVKESQAWSSRDPRVRSLVLNVIDFLTETGEYPKAVGVADQAVNAWGDDPASLMHARLRRNKIRRIHSEYATALAEARDIHREQLDRGGPEADETLEALRAVAIALSGLARFDEAEHLFEQILEHRRARTGSEPDAHTLEAAHDYAQVLQEQGRFDQALLVSERNLRERAALLGPDSVPTLRTDLNLGLTLMSLGRWEEARDRLEECMERFEAISAAETPHALQGLLFLALVHRDLGDTETGLEYSSRALALYRRHYPPTVRQTLYCRVVHMVTLTRAGRRDEAAEEARRVLPPTDERFPDGHPFPAWARVGIGIVLRAQGAFTRAAVMDQAALERLQRIYGPGSFTTLPAALNLATDLYGSERHADARELDALTEAGCRDLVADTHPILLTARRNHLVSRHTLGEDVKEEWSELRRTLAERFGSAHPSVASMSSYTRQDCDVLPVMVV
ncbi:FxSxx-COOH system tetratricopeptide repeat protein [Nocardiopsis lambiniae]|uniref:FxSxx-COOH system tetratricopeptide repeat protein n=1 Tax=Nocardiopsis lambiniae TaxID=3075539 RepID=A0ABU2M2H0_9ACTN|nr:FxSxx-COOH system tetratricopeptide repeat protein [Nocardiopsis sp. DSM 44743]MDT0326839.1 FxSxx-COOH system tetratricopeptide repeat protein [Nocardiopsis sp. DSM 44743]